jgi:hypothetical protein
VSTSNGKRRGPPRPYAITDVSTDRALRKLAAPLRPVQPGSATLQNKRGEVVAVCPDAATALHLASVVNELYAIEGIARRMVQGEFRQRDDVTVAMPSAGEREVGG